MILWVGYLGWVHLDGSLLAFDGLIHVSLTTVSWAALFHGGREHVCMCVCVCLCVWVYLQGWWGQILPRLVQACSYSGRFQGLLVSASFLVAQMVKNLPAMRETWVQSLGQKDPLERGMAYPPQYSCLQNSTDTLVGYSPWACRVGHDWATNNANIKCHLYEASHMAKPNVSVGGHNQCRWLQGSKEYILITCSLWQLVIFDTWTMCWNTEVEWIWEWVWRKKQQEWVSLDSLHTLEGVTL